MASIRSKRVQRSFIRDLLQQAKSGNCISLAGGHPDSSLFPVQPVADAARRLFSLEGAAALQYGETAGDRELRNIIAGWYAEEGIPVNAENILLTTGSQQALDLIGRAYINEQDTVATESPTYLGALMAFALYAPVYKTVPLMEDGPDLSLAAQILERGASVVYLNPVFQNPSGISWSSEKLKELSVLAAAKSGENDPLWICDNPYSRLAYDRPPTGEAAVLEIDLSKGNVVSLGSFSKILAPGLRCGWICGSQKVISRLETLKQGADLHSGSFDQALIRTLLQHFDIIGHADMVADRLKKRRDAMAQALLDHFPRSCAWTPPEGGMFFWVKLPEDVDPLRFYRQALALGVACVPGNPFFADDKGYPAVRLSFASVDEKKITEGVKLAAMAFNQVT